jgi:hypothetical protein
MLSVCRRWAFLILFMLMPLVLGACAGEFYSELYGKPGPGDLAGRMMGDDPAPQAPPLCYPAPAGAPAGAAPVCFHY